MWAFQLLKYFPGQLEGVAILGLGLVIFVGLFGLPFFDRGPKRHPRNRPIATIAMMLIVAGMVFLTIQAVVTTPPQAEAVNVGGDQGGADRGGRRALRGALRRVPWRGRRRRGDQGQAGRDHRPLNSEDFLVAHFDDTIFQSHQLRAARSKGMHAVRPGLRRPAERPGDPGDHCLHPVLGRPAGGRGAQAATGAAADSGQDRESELRQGCEADPRQEVPQLSRQARQRAATGSTRMTMS